MTTPTFKATGPFIKRFSFKDMKLIAVKPNGEPIVSYFSNFKGKDYFAVRSLWFDTNAKGWAPGKGLTIPAEMRKQVAEAFAAQASARKPTRKAVRK